MTPSVQLPLFGCEIPLTSGLVALVDEDLFPVLSLDKWFSWNGYAVSRLLSRFARERGVRHPAVRMHHEVLRLRGIAIPPGYEVDHWNRNKVDNRTENLRVVPPAANARNKPLPSRNTSGYRGVMWSKKSQKWQARITVQGKQHHLGFYATPQEAAVAYEWARRDLGLDAPYHSEAEGLPLGSASPFSWTMRSNNTSGFRGVSWNKEKGGWRAQITVDQRNRILGLYDTPEEASAAYEAARAQLGRTNR